MKTLKVYQIGVDPLPVDDSQIVFWSSTTSFGIFENSFATEGTVRYLLPEEYETFEEAIAGGAKIDLECNYEDEDIIIQCNEHQLGEGINWMYVHEYYPVISSVDFPFQKRHYFDVAIKEGWIEVISHKNTSVSREEYDEMVANTSEEKSHLIVDFEVFRARLDGDVFVVSFNGSNFEVSFQDGGKCFSDYKKLGE